MSESPFQPYPKTFEILDIGGLRSVGGTFHPIDYEITSDLGEHDIENGFAIHIIKFTDAARVINDSALFDFQPNSKTPVVPFTKSGYTIDLQVVEGEGSLLPVSPHGEIIGSHLSGDLPEIIEVGEGWTDFWLSGTRGMKVIESITPIFESDFEKVVVENDVSLPNEFWDAYHRLIKI